MEKERTTRRSLLRALYLLPLVCISLALNAKTKVNYVYEDKNVSTSVVVDEIKMDGESLEGMTLDGILKMIPDVYVDDQGNITSQGHPVKRIVINGKVLYKKEGTANESTTTPKISVIDSQSSMDMEISGMSDEKVDEIIKSLPGVQFDENGNMTINGKPVKKILVDGVEKEDYKFDATAYQIPEGTSMGEVMQGLPGVEVDADGNITVNGKKVTRVLVNGKAVPLEDADSITRAVYRQAIGK